MSKDSYYIIKTSVNDIALIKKWIRNGFRALWRLQIIEGYINNIKILVEKLIKLNSTGKTNVLIIYLEHILFNMTL